MTSSEHEIGAHDDAVSHWAERAGLEGDPAELAGGLLVCGLAFIDRLRDLADEDNAWLGVLSQACNLAVEWLRGVPLSARSDEPELRAQFAHDVLPPDSRGERTDVIAARVLLSLPSGHPLRDTPAQVSVQRQGMLRSRRADDADGELEAVAYLLHHAAPARRTALRLDRRGQLVVPRAHEGIAAQFWASRAGYYSRLALASTSASARRRWAGEALTSAGRLTADEHLSIPSATVLLVQAVATEAAGDHEIAAELYERAANELVDSGTDLESLISAGLLRVTTGHPEIAVGLLRRALPRLAHQDALALTAGEVTHIGGQLTRVASALALEECVAGRWSAGLTALDWAKSLRLRHQLELRQSAEADELLRLEQLEFAMERGAGWIYRGVDGTEFNTENPPYRTEYWLAPEVRLRQAVREQRAAAVRIPESPDPFEVAGHLGDNEAVLVVGLAERGTIAAVLARSDRTRPTAGWVDTTWPASRWSTLMSCLPHTPAGPVIGPILDELGQVLGMRVAEVLGGHGVRRLYVVPHLWLHSIPFHSVPGLSEFDVLHLPSLSSLIRRQAGSSSVNGESIVVGNPTGDLTLAGLEAFLVAERLSAVGMPVLLRRESEAVRDEVRRPGCTLLHFVGHGRSDAVDPQRAALMLCHQAATARVADGRDPLTEMAGDVRDWVEVNNHIREAVIRPAGTLREIRRDDTVERIFEHTERMTVVIRWRGSRAVAADLWSVGEITAAGDLTQCRLAVLTACDAAAATNGPDLLDESSGLPAALMLAGVDTVVAPLRPIAEDTALLFADRFYDILTADEPDRTGRVDAARATRLAQR
jgi:CHAT domain-containing protein